MNKIRNLLLLYKLTNCRALGLQNEILRGLESVISLFCYLFWSCHASCLFREDNTLFDKMEQLVVKETSKQRIKKSFYI